MEIKIKNLNFDYANVCFVEGAVTMDLGTLNENERSALADQLRRAAYELDSVECVTKQSAEAAILYMAPDEDECHVLITNAKAVLEACD